MDKMEKETDVSEKGTLDELYVNFHREMNVIEERRESIVKEIQKLDADQNLFDNVNREMNYLFKEVSRHCEEEQFILSMERCEDEFYDCQRNIENELEEKREQLESERRDTYKKEEELRENLQRKKCLLEN